MLRSGDIGPVKPDRRHMTEETCFHDKTISHGVFVCMFIFHIFALQLHSDEVTLCV